MRADPCGVADRDGVRREREVVAHKAIRGQQPAEPPAAPAKLLRERHFASPFGEDSLPVDPVDHVVNPSFILEPKFARHGRDANPPSVQMSKIT